jgi:hypothetical protein
MFLDRLPSLPNIREQVRHPSPGGRPHPLAFARGTLWVGSFDTSHLYAIDPQTGSVLDEVPAPGQPFGIAAHGDELRVVVSHGEEDDRYAYRFVPGQGFDPESRVACPELTGSHLTSDGNSLYLTQLTKRRLLVLTPDWSIVREIALPAHCAGIGFGVGAFHVLATDLDFERVILGRFDVTSRNPIFEPLAETPNDVRSIAFDGTSWWTNKRETSQIVSFTITR